MFYRQSNQVKVKKGSNNTALYVSDQNGIHVLNETSRFIWEALQEPFTFDELLKPETLNPLEILRKKSYFLFGPRQTGKTSLIQHTLNECRYYNLLKTN